MTFRSTGLSRASTQKVLLITIRVLFRSTGLSRASTCLSTSCIPYRVHFDPQGSREPRPISTILQNSITAFRSTGLSRASTTPDRGDMRNLGISIHRALASLDCRISFGNRLHWKFRSTGLSRASTWRCPYAPPASQISIHRALASLDGKNAQLFLHLCHIYMLHIIHLLQIVFQVEISSRNLIVFSGQL